MSRYLRKLIKRSKTSYEEDPDKLRCEDVQEDLVAISETPKLITDPIWETQLDDLEGPLYKEYIDKNPSYNSIYLRRDVASRLYQAAESLPSNLKLVLRAGHRPLAVQKLEFEELVSRYIKDHPSCKRSEALKFARTYVSDPDITLPPHCCGSAVDVDLFDTRTGKLVDFGCPVNTNNEIAFLHSSSTTRMQKKNRMLLLSAMLNSGFAPDYYEWWHFTYGDTVWAYFYNESESKYGLIEPSLVKY